MSDVPAPRPRPRLLVAYAVLTVSLFITFAAAAYVALTSMAKDRARFENAVERTQLSIQRRLETYENLLVSGAALFTSRSTTRPNFEHFVKQIDVARRYPGIQGIGVAPRIGPDRFEYLRKRMRDEGVSDFRIFPLDPPRAEYFPVIYLEPLDERNKPAIGYDMFSEPTRRAAMEQARDTGQPTATAILTLITETAQDRQRGFLIYVPVYFAPDVPVTVAERRRLLGGFIYAPFRGDDLLQGILGQERFTSGIAYDVYDGERPRPETLLHRSRAPTTTTQAAAADAAEKPQFQKTTTLDVPGRKWTIVYRS